MLALTIWQPDAEPWIPTHAEMWRAYVAGVLHGDGWCTERELGLRTKDHDFAQVFADCMKEGFGFGRNPRQDERGYWLLRYPNIRGRFNRLRGFRPETNDDCTWWLRGLFDSEGNAQFGRCRRGGASYNRRVAFYSTSLATLKQAERYLAALDVPTSMRSVKNSTGHKGTKVVHELRVLRQEGFARFREMVGSSIGRKREALDWIVATYQPPGWQARNWSKAVAARWGASV